MTSIFKLIFRDFDPPATVESAGVRPAPGAVTVDDLPTLRRDFAHLAQLAENRRQSSGPSALS